MNYQEIRSKFEQVLLYSQDIDDIKTDVLFSNWYKNKKRFIDRFGGLTYELDRDIVLTLPEEDKKILFKDLVLECIINCNDSIGIKTFLNSQDINGVFENRVTTPYSNGDINIVKGAKLSKSLKFFFKDNKDALDMIQNRLSRMVQECKTAGRMVISVHPLDFLSSSETAHNWHSCHALDGEYRAGNLSYMQDPHTFMIYIKAKEEYKLPSFPSSIFWNSKKWRTLMYLDEDESIVVSGRQYPFSNSYAFEIASAELIDKFFNTEGFSDWTCIGEKITNIMIDNVYSLQYNDCLNSPSYKPLARFNMSRESEIFKKEEDVEKTRFKIGRPLLCLECENDYVSLSDDFRCDGCGEYVYCDHCGEAIQQDAAYCLGNDTVCEECFDDNGLYCAGCETTFNEFEVDMHWDEWGEEYYCPCCYSSLIEEREAELTEESSEVDL